MSLKDQIPALPVRMVLPLELEKRFVSVDLIEVFKEIIHHFLPALRFLPIRCNAGQGRIPQGDFLDSLRLEKSDAFKDQEIHRPAHPLGGAHQID